MATAFATRDGTEGTNITVVPQKDDRFEELVALTDKIRQRAFEFFQDRGCKDGNDLEDWFKAEAELLQQTPIELRESRQWYTVRTEVPGFAAKDLMVWAGQNSICIHGKNEQKNDKETPYTEIGSHEFYRRIDLPLAIDPNHVSAHLRDGMLDLDIRKAALARRFEAKAA